MYEADWSSAVFDERSLTRGAGGRAGGQWSGVDHIDRRKEEQENRVGPRKGWMDCVLYMRTRAGGHDWDSLAFFYYSKRASLISIIRTDGILFDCHILGA